MPRRLTQSSRRGVSIFLFLAVIGARGPVGDAHGQGPGGQVAPPP